MCQNVFLEVIGNSLHHTGFSGIKGYVSSISVSRCISLLAIALCILRNCAKGELLSHIYGLQKPNFCICHIASNRIASCYDILYKKTSGSPINRNRSFQSYVTILYCCFRAEQRLGAIMWSCCKRPATTPGWIPIFFAKAIISASDVYFEGANWR